MRKALILTVLALFGSEALAKNSLRSTPTIALDDLQDNDLMRTFSSPNPSSYMGSGRGHVGFDDLQDNEMALDLRLPKEPTYRIKFAEDDDEFFTQGDMGRMGGFLGNGGSGIIGGGGSAPGGVAWGGAGQYAHNIGRNTQVIGGASISHAPGSRVGINPHVGVKFSFDDAQDDELFAEDDELFTQGDLGRMSSPFLPGSGAVGGGGSVRGGGLAMGGTGQLNLNIGRNTQLIGGLSASHAPGSRVNFQPHIGISRSF